MNENIGIKKDIILAEILDRVLDKGIVIQGNLVIGIADLDLVYINVQAVITSVENLKRTIRNAHQNNNNTNID